MGGVAISFKAVLVAMIATWLLLSYFSAAQAQIFPDYALDRDILQKWAYGGVNETMNAWIIENYPIEEYGSLMIWAELKTDQINSSQDTWKSYVAQEILNLEANYARR